MRIREKPEGSIEGKKKMMTYTRICKLCGIEFESHANNALYCTECRIVRNKELRAERAKRYKESGHRAKDDAKYRASAKGKATNKRNSKAYRERHRDEIRERRKEYYARTIERSREVSRLYQARLRNVPGAKLAYAKITGKIQTCPRMRLTAVELPCGKREECRGCERCPADATYGADLSKRLHFVEMDGLF